MYIILAPGSPKRPNPCELDNECLDTEACYNGLCEDLCSIPNVCAPTARCHVVKHRPVCTCPPGYQGNPAIKCFLPQPCKILMCPYQSNKRFFKKFLIKYS